MSFFSHDIFSMYCVGPLGSAIHERALAVMSSDLLYVPPDASPSVQFGGTRYP